MGTTNWCPGREKLGSSRDYLRLSAIGSPDFSLCLGMTLRLPLAGFGVISRGCIICGERVESRYKQRVEATIEYAKSIDDFDDLVDPRTLALYYLGPVPSIYVLHTIEREKKKSKHFI